MHERPASRHGAHPMKGVTRAEDRLLKQRQSAEMSTELKRGVQDTNSVHTYLIRHPHVWFASLTSTSSALHRSSHGLASWRPEVD